MSHTLRRSGTHTLGSWAHTLVQGLIHWVSPDPGGWAASYFPPSPDLWILPGDLCLEPWSPHASPVLLCIWGALWMKGCMRALESRGLLNSMCSLPLRNPLGLRQGVSTPQLSILWASWMGSCMQRVPFNSGTLSGYWDGRKNQLQGRDGVE